MPDDPLERLGFDERMRDAFAQHAEAGLVPGRVARVDRGQAVVLTRDGEIRAEPATRLVSSAATGVDLPAVGDWVALRNAPDMDLAMIEAVLPRHSAFIRKDPKGATDAQVLAANIDVAFIVHALANDPNISRIERELVVAWESGATPVVVLNKADLSDDPESARVSVEASAPGVSVHVVSAETGDGLDEVAGEMDSTQTAVFIGPSGVGKSSLINRLAGSDIQTTQDVRGGDHKGRHTTVARELFELPSGGSVIDTPGLRALALWDADTGIAAAFSDVEEYAADCRFRDCKHETEPGCGVRAAVDRGDLEERRLDSYHRLARELEQLAIRQDVRLRREHERQLGQMYRTAKDHWKRTR